MSNNGQFFVSQKIRNVLKRMQNQISDLYLLRYGRFCTQKFLENVDFLLKDFCEPDLETLTSDTR